MLKLDIDQQYTNTKTYTSARHVTSAIVLMIVEVAGDKRL